MYFGKSRAEWQRPAKDFLIGCSLVSLLYINIWGRLFAATTPNAFFLAYSPHHYLAAIAALLAGGVLAAALSPAIRRTRPSVRYFTSLLFLATLVIALNELRKSSEGPRPSWLNAWTSVRQIAGLPVLIIVGLLLLALVMRYAIPLARFYARALLTLSFFTAFVLTRGVWVLATMNFDSFRPPVPPAPSRLLSAHRVVIVVFDELDYELAFTRRPADLNLQNFDALKMTSVTFDSAYAPGSNTIESMPSYLLGGRVKSLHPISANSFSAVLNDGRTMHSDTARSIFSKLAARGARTALVGFALPYCRLRLTAMVDHCEEIPNGGGGTVHASSESFWRAIAEQTRSLLPFSGRLERIELMRRAMASSADLAADSSYTLVFLHLPIPHFPWIWDRRTNQFRVNIAGDEGYFGNLELADRLLGHMRQEMTRRGTWDSTTLIVTADHPWRLKLSRGGGDSRIPLMIKLPQMKQGVSITTPVNSILVSSLLLPIIEGKIPDDAALRLRVTGDTGADSTARPGHT